MTAIISSVVAVDNIQIDMRRVVQEVHIDDKGNVFTYDYMANVDTDVNQKMLDRVPEVLEEATALQAVQESN